MTKDQVKTLAEGDPQLQWWAAVLFAEVCELVHGNVGWQDGWRVVQMKHDEFCKIVQQRAVELASGAVEAKDSLEQRVVALEAQLAGLLAELRARRILSSGQT